MKSRCSTVIVRFDGLLTKLIICRLRLSVSGLPMKGESKLIIGRVLRTKKYAHYDKT